MSTNPFLSFDTLPEADSPHSLCQKFDVTGALLLNSGAKLTQWQLAYQTYGTLNADKSNAILICHALTGDQHVANTHPRTGKSGWWTTLVGPKLPFDTERYYIICANVLGGCMGSTGPASTNPATGKPYGLSLPLITIADMVRAQEMLLDALGIDMLFCVAGGSMGGMQVLQWAATSPERVFSAIPIATSARHSSQNIAFHEVGRQAIMADPDWCEGAYLECGKAPLKGLAVARMGAHITYMSGEALHAKFGRRLQNNGHSFSFNADFEIESYLRHQGARFVERFDANSYLYVTRAMDYFDLAGANGGRLADSFRDRDGKPSPTRFCVISFTSDWLFPTSESRALVRALNGAGAMVSFVEVETNKGHDAFLLDEPDLAATVRGFLAAAHTARGLPKP